MEVYPHNLKRDTSFLDKYIFRWLTDMSIITSFETCGFVNYYGFGFISLSR